MNNIKTLNPKNPYKSSYSPSLSLWITEHVKLTTGYSCSLLILFELFPNSFHELGPGGKKQALEEKPENVVVYIGILFNLVQNISYKKTITKIIYDKLFLLKQGI